MKKEKKLNKTSELYKKGITTSILIITIFNFLFAQNNEEKLFDSIQIKAGKIIFEKIVKLDSLNNKELVFNAAKNALIKNTNYKYSKIDEDRVSGNISSNVNFIFSAKPGISKININCHALLTIDVKENRYRVRLLNNEGSWDFSMFGVTQTTPLQIDSTYKYEKALFDNDNWKPKKSILLPWVNWLSLILEGFSTFIKDGISDDF